MHFSYLNHIRNVNYGWELFTISTHKALDDKAVMENLLVDLRSILSKFICF